MLKRWYNAITLFSGQECLKILLGSPIEFFWFYTHKGKSGCILESEDFFKKMKKKGKVKEKDIPLSS